jgi:hypothetical protein
MSPEIIGRWIDALVARHTRSLRQQEFLKGIRALSARYVEGRSRLGRSSPIDSAGKRAAFAAFFAPLHLATVAAVVAEVHADARPLREIVDLGCGTGTASAAWALRFGEPPRLVGIDRHPWVLDEAAWNWRALALPGRTRQADLVGAAEALAGSRLHRRGPTGIILAWSVNELSDADRDRLLPALLTIARGAATILVIEPLARRAVPWWGTWAEACRRRDGRVDEWKFPPALPSSLAALSEAAGFRRDVLGARSLWFPGSC